jgi:hypothetical protein
MELPSILRHRQLFWQRPEENKSINQAVKGCSAPNSDDHPRLSDNPSREQDEQRQAGAPRDYLSQHHG